MEMITNGGIMTLSEMKAVAVATSTAVFNGEVERDEAWQARYDAKYSEAKSELENRKPIYSDEEIAQAPSAIQREFMQKINDSGIKYSAEQIEQYADAYADAYASGADAGTPGWQARYDYMYQLTLAEEQERRQGQSQMMPLPTPEVYADAVADAYASGLWLKPEKIKGLGIVNVPPKLGLSCYALQLPDNAGGEMTVPETETNEETMDAADSGEVFKLFETSELKRPAGTKQWWDGNSAIPQVEHDETWRVRYATKYNEWKEKLSGGQMCSGEEIELIADSYADAYASGADENTPEWQARYDCMYELALAKRHERDKQQDGVGSRTLLDGLGPSPETYADAYADAFASGLIPTKNYDSIPILLGWSDVPKLMHIYYKTPRLPDNAGGEMTVPDKKEFELSDGSVEEIAGTSTVFELFDINKDVATTVSIQDLCEAAADVWHIKIDGVRFLSLDDYRKKIADEQSRAGSPAVPHSEFSVPGEGSYVYSGYAVGVTGCTWGDFTYDSSRGGYTHSGSEIIDAEKSNDAHDSQMCWAAANANALTWTGWLTSDMVNEDQVFDAYRQSFQSGAYVGGHPYYGFDWFLTGHHAPTISSGGGDHCYSGTGGYFSSAVTSANLGGFVANAVIDPNPGGGAVMSNVQMALEAGKGVNLDVTFFALSSAYEDSGHSLQTWGYICNPQDWTPSDPQYYIGVIVSDSDDDMYHYADMPLDATPYEISVAAPNVLKIIPILWNGYFYELSSAYVANSNYIGAITGFTTIAPASFTTLSSGTTLVSRAATLLGKDVGAGMAMYVSSAGLANHSEVSGGGKMYVLGAGMANETTLASGGTQYVLSGALAKDTMVNSGGRMILYGGASLSGETRAGGQIIVSGMVNANGGTLDFALTEQSVSSSALVNGLIGISNVSSYEATVNRFVGGTRTLATVAGTTFAGTMDLRNEAGQKVTEVSTTEKGFGFNRTYSLSMRNGALMLSVENVVSDNLLENGYGQIVAWNASNGAVGYAGINGSASPTWHGVWQWDNPSMWRVDAVGHFNGSASLAKDGLLLYNRTNNTFAAWTNLSTGDYGYVSLGYVDDDFHTVCLGDFDNSGYDDVLIVNDAGSFGIMCDASTYHDVWHVEPGTSSVWEIKGAGYFGHDDGKYDLVVYNSFSQAYYKWHNGDISFATWSWDSLLAGAPGSSCEFAGIGDLQNDGLDDLIFRDTSTGRVFAWNDGNSASVRELGTLSSAYAVEGVGEYDGAAGEDLLLRDTSTGSLSCWGGGASSSSAMIGISIDSSFAIIH